MKGRLSNLGVIILILVLISAIGVCTYSYGDSMNMNGEHSSSSMLFDHIEHAHSLVQAISHVDLSILSLFVIIAWVFVSIPLKLSFKYKKLSPKLKLLFGPPFGFSPRSPPVHLL